VNREVLHFSTLKTLNHTCTLVGLRDQSLLENSFMILLHLLKKMKLFCFTHTETKCDADELNVK